MKDSEISSDPVKSVLAGTEAYLRAWSWEGTMDWTKFEHIFMPGHNGIQVVDTYSGKVTVLHSYQEYVDTWSPAVASYWRNQHTVAEDGKIRIEACGDIGVSMFVLHSEGELVDESTGRGLLRQEATLVWKLDPVHGWRVIREHLTSLPGSK